MKTKLMILTIILAFASLYAIDTLYAGMEDKADRLSNDQAGIFSPGYINAATQKTREIIHQANKYKSPIEDTAERVKDKLSDDVMEDSANKVTPELKKKTDRKGENRSIDATAVSIETTIIDSTDYNVKIGSGTNQRDIDGRLVSESGKAMVSEVIDGIKYHYAGFISGTGGTIQAAINRADDGEIVIVKSGIRGGFTLTKSLKVYGGYDDNGNVVSTTVINGGIIKIDGADNVEISGIDIKGLSYVTPADVLRLTRADSLGAIVISNSTGVNIRDSVLRGYYGVLIKNSTVSLSNNMITGGLAGIGAIGSSVTATDNNIAGVAVRFGTILAGRITTIYQANTGYGISGETSIFYLIGNTIDSYPGIQKVNINNNSVASYLEHSTQPSAQNTGLTLQKDNTSDAQKRFFSYDKLNNEITSSTTNLGGDGYKTLLGFNKLGYIFKGLLANKDALQTGQTDPGMLVKIVENVLGKYALVVPQDTEGAQDMQIASILSSIIRNPTEDQKMMLDAVTALLNEVNKQEQEGSASPELKKATDDLLQMVASVLIAQAIPDLLKEGDVSNIKSIFASLNTEKSRIVLEYQESTRPYYDQMVKELSKNMSLLQLKNILSNSITKEELAKIPPNELAKIMEKLQQSKDKSFEEEYILQQEAKYRKEYMDPNKKILEEKMKGMMRDFTKKLSGVLDGVKSEKK